MEGEMVNQPTADYRLIDRRSVLRTGAALVAAGRDTGFGAHTPKQYEECGKVIHYTTPPDS
jgi:hypothetical protein